MRNALGHQCAPGQVQKYAQTDSLQIERTLAVAYEKLQVTVTQNVPGVDTPATSPADTDFSPQAVTDRVLGFIQDRLESERANGASEEEIQALYQQAVKGVEQGLREAKDIIQAQGLFAGEVQDNFYATVTKLADGLEALGESLFGVELDGSDDTTPPEVAPPNVVQDLNYQSSEVAFQRARSFDLQVTTREGDTVTLRVSSGQSGYAKQTSLQTDGLSAVALDAGFSRYDNLAFSVEGDLDEGELAALQDLFAQVNTVAETFYGGDVEQAFDQAMGVGMDSEELAAFAVDLRQSETVAVRDTYVAIDNMAGSRRPNTFADVMPRLGDFAKGVQQASDNVKMLESGRLQAPELLRELISRFHADTAAGEGYGEQFKRFIGALA
ncbi:MAG: hypothetical protein D9N11_14120 [Ketobacter sp.]|nr:MAG: hypothetical protein D9N11_14120 [Ketobacter sp.]